MAHRHPHYILEILLELRCIWEVCVCLILCVCFVAGLVAFRNMNDSSIPLIESTGSMMFKAEKAFLVDDEVTGLWSTGMVGAYKYATIL